MLRRSAESLAEILGADRERVDLFTSTVATVPLRHVAYRSDKDDGLKLPLVVQPANFDLEEFFVNVAAYHQARSPATAFMHVLDEECSLYFSRSSPTAPLGTPALNRCFFGALGSAVGETFLAAIGSTEAGAAPSYASCRRSLSFALARARLIHPSCRTEYLANRWARLRQLTGLASSDETVAAVSTIHSLLFEGDVEPSASRREFPPAGLSTVTDLKAVQRALIDSYPQIAPYVSGLGGPFDARMKAFSSIVEGVRRAPKGAMLDSFTIGFHANQIQAGSFVHAKALAKLVDSFPTALVWYGMFCGLSSEFDPVEFGSGLIAKMTRDATQPFNFERRPGCDLSLEEMEVLMRLPARTEILKPSQQKIVVVAVMPGVDIPSRYSVDDGLHVGSEERRASESDDATIRVTRLLEDALALIRGGKAPLRRAGGARQRRQGRAKP